MCTHDYHRRIYLELARAEEARGNYALARFYRARAAEHVCCAGAARSG